MKILILGGSKFMGLHFVEQLIAKNELLMSELFIVNRGNAYWDGMFYQIIKGKNYIRHYKVDRKEENSFLNTLQMMKEDNSDFKFDYIVDFSCYKKRNLNFLKFVDFVNYIFISTDSTYNVSPMALERDDEYFINKGDFEEVPLIIEENSEPEAERIKQDKEMKKKLKRRDSYGYKKLKCEDEIKRIFEGFGTNSERRYIMFRLPDVIGSYDESFRLWYYMEWLKYSETHPVELEKVDTVRRLSFVLKDDVVETIMKVIFDTSLDREKIMNQEYNLACMENLTLLDVLNFTAEKLGLKLVYKVVERAHTYYPSVTIGAIDCSKAINILNFKPTSIFESISKEIEFFIYAGKNQRFVNEYKEMVDDLPKVIKNELN